MGSGLCLVVVLLSSTVSFVAGDGRRENPLGLKLAVAGSRTSDRLALARDLGVSYVRPRDVVVEQWRGPEPESEAFRQAGFELILAVRSESSPAEELPPSYGDTVAEILETQRPALLVVGGGEYGEDPAILEPGHLERYGRELGIACAAAHARGIPCSNAGAASADTALLVWAHYQAGGQTQRARDFASRALSAPQQATLLSGQGGERIEAAISRTKALLELYCTAGIDYVSLEWGRGDPAALADTVRFIQQATGRPTILSAFNPTQDDPRLVMALLTKAVALGLRFVVWAGDAPFADRQGEPRTNGEAFRRFLQERQGASGGAAK